MGRADGACLQAKKAEGAFRVLLDSYVTSDSGTGIVHQAPGFGEDDYRVCLKYGIVKKVRPPRRLAA